MPAMKRSEWIKLIPDEKVVHRLQRTIGLNDTVQNLYDHVRASGKLAEPFPYLEHS